MISYGKVAYDAYCEDAGGVSLVTGDKLPSHADLPVEIRRAWDAAAEAVLDSYTGENDWDRDECISETPPNGHDEQPACPICSKRAARMKRLPQWFHDLADLVDTSDDWVCENPDAIHRVLEHLDYSVREDLVGCLVDMVEELKKTT